MYTTAPRAPPYVEPGLLNTMGLAQGSSSSTQVGAPPLKGFDHESAQVALQLGGSISLADLHVLGLAPGSMMQGSKSHPLEGLYRTVSRERATSTGHVGVKDEKRQHDSPASRQSDGKGDTDPNARNVRGTRRRDGAKEVGTTTDVLENNDIRTRKRKHALQTTLALQAVEKWNGLLKEHEYDYGDEDQFVQNSYTIRKHPRVRTQYP